MPIVVVPPVLLVKMFGVPELVRLPTKAGESVVFTAYGKEWLCKYICRDTLCLRHVGHDHHARWGTARQIAADIGHVLETGALPCSKGVCCF